MICNSFKGGLGHFLFQFEISNKIDFALMGGVFNKKLITFRVAQSLKNKTAICGLQI